MTYWRTLEGQEKGRGRVGTPALFSLLCACLPRPQRGDRVARWLREPHRLTIWTQGDPERVLQRAGGSLGCLARFGDRPVRGYLSGVADVGLGEPHTPVRTSRDAVGAGLRGERGEPRQLVVGRVEAPDVVLEALGVPH